MGPLSRSCWIEPERALRMGGGVGGRGWPLRRLPLEVVCRIRTEGIVTTTTRAGAIAAVCLLVVASCDSDSDDAASASPTSAAETTEAPDTTPETEPETVPDTSSATTEAPATTEPSADEPSTTSAEEDLPLLESEFEAVPAGRYRVETIGAPFVIDVPEGWWVQPNSLGRFVLTDAESQGPGDRDIVMIRPSNLADPDQPTLPPEEQVGDWPLDDIEGWLGALVPGVVVGDAVDTTLGGLDAVQFDVAIDEGFECGDGFCVGFATNRRVNNMWFDPETNYRVWWIDGGDESPIAVNIGDGADPEFLERAEAVLDTMVFESVGPNPIPSEGNLWELGFPSEVPAGSVTLPVGPGVTFEQSEPHFVFQNEFFSGVLLDGPGEVDILFPDEAFDGEPLATVDDVVAALERDTDLDATVVGTREVSGYEATQVEVVFSGPEPGPDGPPPKLRRSELPDVGWRPPPDGVLWVMEATDGIAVVTAEWFEPFVMEPALALAEEILDSIVIGV